jgi:cation diffusion facilitator CzcD-associated flavoprotein CzcO
MPDTDIAIIGAGFGGLGAAIRLKQEGIEDFVVLERGADVGGTWFANSYPGCQCDVPSNLYSFSFAPKADWSHSYPQQQILDYMRDCARRFGIDEHIRLNCELLGATWSASDRQWTLETGHGEVRARVLIAAPGLLSEPTLPRIPGLEGFGGRVFHSAAWDHEHEFSGKRMALLGTGATAVQIAPRIRPLLERLHVLQRTPPWVLRHPGRPISPRLQRAYRSAPALQRLARLGVYALRESLGAGMAYEPRLLKGAEFAARAHLRRQVADLELRRQLAPDYSLGCKRLLLSNEWYPTLTAPNCEVVTDPIAEITESGVLTADGTERDVDTIIWATGFAPTDPPIARRLHAGDRSLSDVWGGSPQAFLGTTVAGFPNLFLLYGPNLNLGHSSIVYMLEAQIHYVLEALRAMRVSGAGTMDVRAEAQERWNAALQERLRRTVWNRGGCSSWYVDANGCNSVMWPGFTFRYRRRVNRFNPADYILEPEPAEVPADALVVTT